MGWIGDGMAQLTGRAQLQERVNALEIQVKSATAQLRLNGFDDFLAGFGDMDRDPVARMQFKPERRLTRKTAEDLYQFNGVAAAIVDAPADDATRKGIDLLSEVGPLDDVERYLEALPYTDGLPGRKVGVLLAINRALKLARQLRAGVLVVIARDGRNPWEPLDENNITSVDKVLVHHAYEVWPHAWYSDGTPELYQLAPDQSRGGGRTLTLVHESRTFPLTSMELTAQRQAITNGWSDSALQRVVRALMRDDFVADQATRLTARKNVQAYSTPGLKSQVDKDNGEALRKRLRQIWQAMSMLRVFPMDEKENVVTLDASLSGLPDLLDRYPYRVAAAARMPMTKLYGMSTGGLNATGEHDLTNYYDNVQGSLVRVQVMPAYRWIGRLVCLSRSGPTGGVLPEGFRAEMRPLREMTRAQVAEAELTEARADDLRIKQGFSVAQIAAERGLELEPEGAPAAGDNVPEPGAAEPPGEDEERNNALLSAQVAVRFNGPTGDGSRLAVMIPARHLEGYVPRDNPHVTLVYLSNVGDRREEALQIIRQVIAEHARPFRCELGNLNSILSPDGLLVFHLPVYAERWTHEDLREEMVDALMREGFAVSFPRRWLPHLTLGIEADPRASWTGCPPQSSWYVDRLEVWGGEEVEEITF